MSVTPSHEWNRIYSIGETKHLYCHLSSEYKHGGKWQVNIKRLCCHILTCLHVYNSKEHTSRSAQLLHVCILKSTFRCVKHPIRRIQKNSKRIGRCPSEHRTMNVRAPKIDGLVTERWPSGHLAMIWVELPTVEIRRVILFAFECFLQSCRTVPGRTSADVIIHRRKPAPVRNVTTHWKTVFICPVPGRISNWRWVANRRNRKVSVSYVTIA